jgi:hypothetical protein
MTTGAARPGAHAQRAPGVPRQRASAGPCTLCRGAQPLDPLFNVGNSREQCGRMPDLVRVWRTCETCQVSRWPVKPAGVRLSQSLHSTAYSPRPDRSGLETRRTQRVPGAWACTTSLKTATCSFARWGAGRGYPLGGPPQRGAGAGCPLGAPASMPGVSRAQSPLREHEGTPRQAPGVSRPRFTTANLCYYTARSFDTSIVMRSR